MLLAGLSQPRETIPTQNDRTKLYKTVQMQSIEKGTEAWVLHTCKSSREEASEKNLRLFQQSFPNLVTIWNIA